MISLLLAAALGLSSMTVASAATYNLVLAAPTKAGSAQLDPGAYQLAVDGNRATFTNVNTNKSVMAVVRVDSGIDAYGRTTLEVKDEDGAQRIESIELENSMNKLEF
jgi:hypothetical protein